jgi:hypothetical protein
VDTETEIKGKDLRIADREADAMSYTLPLQQNHVAHTQLEAQERKGSEQQNMEAAEQAKVIGSRVEGGRKKSFSEALSSVTGCNANGSSDDNPPPPATA